MFKRIIALALCLILVVSLVPGVMGDGWVFYGDYNENAAMHVSCYFPNCISASLKEVLRIPPLSS